MADVTLRAALLVAAGGAVGALARWGVGVGLARHYPAATLVVNLVGSFLVGLLLFGGAARAWPSAPEDARLLLAVGALGAFTTMSAFAYESVELLARGRMGALALHVALHPLLSVAAAWLGRRAALALWGGG